MPFWFYTPLYLHCRWKTRKYRMIGNRYRLIRQIGRGSTGLVYLAIDIKTHTRCAIKEICKQKNRQESSILKELGPHKNIIGFIEVIEDSGSIYLGKLCMHTPPYFSHRLNSDGNGKERRHYGYCASFPDTTLFRPSVQAFV